MKLYNRSKALSFFLIIVLLSVAACRKDIGNYDYQDITEIEIEGISNTYEIRLGESPNVYPELRLSTNKVLNEQDYKFEWISYDPNALLSIRKKIIHTGKNLNIIPSLGVGKYNMYCNITELKTGIVWQRNFAMNIVGEYKKSGWFVLNDVNEKARVDYYEDNSADWHSYPNVYRDITNLILDPLTNKSMELKGKPKFLASYTNRVSGIPSASTSSNKYFVYIGTEGSTEKLNVTDGFIWRAAAYAFVNETYSGNPEVMDRIYPAAALTSLGVADGELYSANYTGRVSYGVPLNQLTTGQTFKISPYLAVPSTSGLVSLMFDVTNKQFLRSSGVYNRYASKLPAGNFDPSNVSKDLIWMDYTNAFAGQAVALLKDADGHIFLARMGFSSSGTFSAISMTDVTDLLTDITKAEHFAMEQQYGYFFYAVGSKVYQYDMDARQLNMVKDYGSRKLSMLKSNRTLTNVTATNAARYESVKYALIVGTYDEASPNTSGTLDFLKVPSLMQPLSTYYSFDGLAKVVDVTYSETQ